MLVSWSYLALQFADVCDDQTINVIEVNFCISDSNGRFKEAREHSSHVLASTIIIENSHQSAQRVATVARNLRDARGLGEKLGRCTDVQKEIPSEEIPPIKKVREEA